jgi:hypothetical protein
MEKFFDDVGVGCGGPRRLNVYRAYKDHFPAPGPKCCYAVMRALQTHPRRAEYVRENPDMTKAKADGLMKEYIASSEYTASCSSSRPLLRAPRLPRRPNGRRRIVLGRRGKPNAGSKTF